MPYLDVHLGLDAFLLRRRPHEQYMTCCFLAALMSSSAEHCVYGTCASLSFSPAGFLRTPAFDCTIDKETSSSRKDQESVCQGRSLDTDFTMIERKGSMWAYLGNLLVMGGPRARLGIPCMTASI